MLLANVKTRQQNWNFILYQCVIFALWIRKLSDLWVSDYVCVLRTERLSSWNLQAINLIFFRVSYNILATPENSNNRREIKTIWKQNRTISIRVEKIHSFGMPLTIIIIMDGNVFSDLLFSSSKFYSCSEKKSNQLIVRYFINFLAQLISYIYYLFIVCVFHLEFHFILHGRKMWQIVYRNSYSFSRSMRNNNTFILCVCVYVSDVGVAVSSHRCDWYVSDDVINDDVLMFVLPWINKCMDAKSGKKTQKMRNEKQNA